MTDKQEQMWAELWQRGLELAQKAKNKGLTMQEVIDTYDRKIRENLSDSEETNAVCDEFMGLLKEEIERRWDKYSGPN